MDTTKLYIGSDHAGFELKHFLIKNLQNNHSLKNIIIEDKGTHNQDSVDYPDIANLVAECVANNGNSKGILVCGSGQGMAITANKTKKIRAALTWNENTTRLSRQHNDANILCLGARELSNDFSLKLVMIFLSESFQAGRHKTRIDKISI